MDKDTEIIEQIKVVLSGIKKAETLQELPSAELLLRLREALLKFQASQQRNAEEIKNFRVIKK